MSTSNRGEIDSSGACFPGTASVFYALVQAGMRAVLVIQDVSRTMNGTKIRRGDQFSSFQ